MARKCMAMTGWALAMAWTFPMAGFCAGGVAVSSQALKMQDDLKDLADSDKKAQDSFYDRNEMRDGLAERPGAVFAGRPGNQTGSPGILAQAKGVLFSAVPAPVMETLSSRPGVKVKGGLNNLQASPDGNLYRSTKESPWWKFWDSGRSIQKAVAGQDGALWNEQGEFVGDWKTVLKTETDNFQVAKGKDGQDHIYTIKNPWSGNPEVSRDGKYVTTFGERVGDFFTREANLKEIRVGANDKVYVRYAKNAEDVILSADAQTKQQKLEARVPAQVKIWTEVKTRQVPHTREVVTYDSDGDRRTSEETYYTSEVYTEQHVDRTGVEQMRVNQDGRIFTQYKNNVFQEGEKGDRKLLAGSKGHWYTWDNPIGDVPQGSVKDFQVDPHGNLYTVERGQVVVNNQAMGSLDSGGQDLRVDGNGNVYKSETRGLSWDPYLRRYNVNPDPANATRAAAGD